jgi:2-phospho-L-lactate guanylyltransferase
VSAPLVILPIKSVDEAKQRLRAKLEPTVRRSLVEAMFSDVLVALSRCAAVDQVLVVSGDHGVQGLATGYGAMVVEDELHGHNRAAGCGIDRAVELGAERVLLVPGDCPLLDAAELEALITRETSERSVLIVPDRHGTGTNALLLAPPVAVHPAFGPGSRRRHEQIAAQAGVAAEVVEVPSLALDVDTPEDLIALRAAFETRRGGAAHTRGLMAQLARAGQL